MRLAEFIGIGASVTTIIAGALRIASWKASNPGRSISDALSGFFRPDPKEKK